MHVLKKNTAMQRDIIFTITMFLSLDQVIEPLSFQIKFSHDFPITNDTHVWNLFE